MANHLMKNGSQTLKVCTSILILDILSKSLNNVQGGIASIKFHAKRYTAAFKTSRSAVETAFLKACENFIYRMR